MKKSVIVSLTLVLVIFGIGLTYLLIDSISKPVKFQKAKDRLYEKAIQRLIEIREAQEAHKEIHGFYTNNFDSLIKAIQQDSFAVVRAIGTIPDELTDSLPLREAEAIALKRGLITRDSVKISVLDSLVRRKNKPINLDSLALVPFGNGTKFELDTASVESSSGVKIKVFEARVHNDVLLKGLERMEIINLNEEAKRLNKYPGLKVGDIVEPNNNEGNWK